MREGSHYKPFGSLLPGRNYSSGSYRHGFNGMEKDDEIHGATATSYDFGARMYDARVARFLSVDRYAEKFANLSPYLYAGNTPIQARDINGDSLYFSTHALACDYATKINSALGKAFGSDFYSAVEVHSTVVSVQTADGVQSVQRHFIVPNPQSNANWNQGSASLGEFLDVLLSPRLTRVLSVESGTKPPQPGPFGIGQSRNPLTIDQLGGGYTMPGEKAIYVHGDLNTSAGKLGSSYMDPGAILLHEATIHLHPDNAMRDGRTTGLSEDMDKEFRIQGRGSDHGGRAAPYTPKEKSQLREARGKFFDAQKSAQDCR